MNYMFYCQSVDPLSISDEKIDDCENKEESESDEGGKFDQGDSDSDTSEAKHEPSKTNRSEEIVVVSI